MLFFTSLLVSSVSKLKSYTCMHHIILGPLSVNFSETSDVASGTIHGNNVLFKGMRVVVVLLAIHPQVSTSCSPHQSYREETFTPQIRS